MWKNFLCVFMMTTGFEQNTIGFKLTSDRLKCLQFHKKFFELFKNFGRILAAPLNFYKFQKLLELVKVLGEF